MKLIIPILMVAALGLSACEVNTPAGAPGPAGPAGAAGSKGTAGANGSAGADGATGAQGKTAPGTVVVVPVPGAEQH